MHNDIKSKRLNIYIIDQVSHSELNTQQSNTKHGKVDLIKSNNKMGNENKSNFNPLPTCDHYLQPPIK